MKSRIGKQKSVDDFAVFFSDYVKIIDQLVVSSCHQERCSCLTASQCPVNCKIDVCMMVFVDNV